MAQQWPISQQDLQRVENYYDPRNLPSVRPENYELYLQAMYARRMKAEAAAAAAKAREMYAQKWIEHQKALLVFNQQQAQQRAQAGSSDDDCCGCCAVM